TVPAVGGNIQLLSVPSPRAQNAEGGLPLLRSEQWELDASHTARDFQDDAGSVEEIASILAMLPNVEIATKPNGLGIAVHWGSSQLWSSLTAWDRHLQNQSAKYTYEASHAGRMAGYFRRQQEWSLQSNLAAGEIM